MGFSLSWVAIDAAAEKTLFEHFGLEELEESADMPDFKLSGALLQGWYLMVADRTDALVDEQLLKSLSEHGRVIAAMVEEHVMFSSAEEWLNGERVWGAIHVSDAGLLHIGVEGDLPNSYATIHQNLFAQQEKDGGKDADVDHIIDIPLELAAELTGYRHDTDGWPFRELRAARPPRPNAKQRPIDGACCQKGLLDKKASKWYMDQRASRPDPGKQGFFGRLFGKL
jgi:hypothetical protein